MTSPGMGLMRAGVGVVAAWVAAVALLGSPMPASAAVPSDGFTDDDGHLSEQAFDALAELGVLDGTECSQGRICPGDPIPRWVVAVWLVRVVDGGNPAPADASLFADVDPQEWWAPFPGRLSRLGITTGCSAEPARFCPDRPVTRAQMAVLLVRAFDLAPVATAAESAAPAFVDIEDSFARRHIGALAAAGITGGCSTDPLRFCPSTAVTRGQMALFLARATGLVELPASVRFTAIDAGWDHTCGLRPDRSAVCWGANHDGQTDAPRGEFTAVSAGGSHSCGLRADETITCWGNNQYGQADAPAGAFSAVSAGWDQTCGLRPDRRVVCWGATYGDQPGPPRGEFTAVSAGQRRSCGIYADGTVACWGDTNGWWRSDFEGMFSSVAAGEYGACAVRADAAVICSGSNHSGEHHAPDGSFAAIAAGRHHFCGLRADATVTCWGFGRDGQADAPRGRYTAVTAGERHSCALRANGTVACWGDIGDMTRGVPEGRIGAVSAGGSHACAVRADAAVVCWGNNSHGRSHPPEGSFTAVSAGRHHSCAIHADTGAAACWGNNFSGQTDAPQGEFTAVAAGEHHSCAIHADTGAAACWGNNFSGQTDAPQGEFTAVAAGNAHSCGLRTGGTIACWGDNQFGQTDAPRGKFAAISTADGWNCAVRAGNGAAVCWGDNRFGQADTPPGAYASVAAGSRSSCGLRADGTVACWGPALVDPPIGAGAAPSKPGDPDPGRCRPYASRGFTLGFPLPPWVLPSAGTLRVAVVFVDFPDAAAAHTTRREAELGLPDAERYLEGASYGRLDVEFEPLHRWLRAPSGHRAFLGSLTNENLLRLAGLHVDLSGHDALLVVLPSSHFGGGFFFRAAAGSEGSVHVAVTNTFAHEPGEPRAWGFVGAHELAHGLGLLDLYTLDAGDKPDPPEGTRWVDTEIGLMGLHSLFAAAHADERFAYEWIYPDGGRTTSYASHLDTREMLAWNRWQLGWLDQAQIRCVAGTEATVSLAAIADPGDGTAMAAVPLSGHEILVIESRRKVGYDAGRPFASASGARTTFPGLITEGVLVYTADTRIAAGRLPITVAGDSRDMTANDYPILQPGQTVTVRGYKITVVSDDGHTHTVTITKAPA